MWTQENRSKYNRDHLRYPSDLTDDEWAYVKPLIPPAKPGGGKRRNRHALRHERGDVYPEHRLPMALPTEGFSAVQHVHHYFVWWQCDGVLDCIHHALYVEMPREGGTRSQPHRRTRPVADLKPRDRIDVQSFIWAVGRYKEDTDEKTKSGAAR
jgi:putative transposase